MRSLSDARNSWRELLQYDTLRRLKDAVRLDGSSSIATGGCRSACWKAFLLVDNVEFWKWPPALSSSRSAYNSLRSHFLRHIDNPDEIVSGYDPLNHDDESNEVSPWVQLRKDEDLRGEILQDVARCMPENLYFRQPETQRMMTDILFIFCKLNPDIGYRQGMHELLAPVLWVVENDAVELGQSSKILGDDATINAVFSAEHIEHDSFALFGQIMQSAKNFYEQTTISGSENPMVSRSKKIFNGILPKVDAALAKHLDSIDIVPQIFLMRWIRLLFGREFGFDDMLAVWDVILAEDPTLEIVDHVCIAMLLRIRWQLIDADYNEALTLLLRYSEVEQGFAPQTFVLDAIYLSEHMDHHGGSHLVFNYSGRPLSQSGRPITPPAIQRNITAFSGQNSQKSNSTDFGLSSISTRRVPNFEAAFQATAKTIYARGEKLGIGKAVRSAVDEVHKKAQEIRYSQTPSPPVTWRQRGPRSSVSASSLYSQMKKLEDRSKHLSKLLEAAVSELWDYQKLIAENEEESGQNPDANHLEKLSLAIAKVQFVQVYLNDPTLPLLEDPQQAETAQETGADSALAAPAITMTHNTSELEDGTLDNEIGQRSHLEINKADQLNAEVLADPSTFEDFAESSVAVDDKVPEVIVQPQPSITTRESTSRPTLEQSSYSWILGQRDPSTRSLSSASPFHGEQPRDRGSLFGDKKNSNSEMRRVNGKTFDETGDADDNADDKGFDLSSLRRSRGGHRA